MPDLFLALDFGGTKHTIGVIERGAKAWRGHERVFSPPGADASYDLASTTGAARRLLNGARPTAIGVSFGGPVDAARGHVLLSDHVPGWEDFPLRERLEAQFGAPARVDNDGNVGALGEHRFGAGQGLNSLLYITVSTGVGGGWILNGRLWHGADSMAGEIGHTTVDYNGPVCECGRRGCVERLAAGPNIADRAREWLQERPDQGATLRAMVHGDLDAITAQVVSRAADAGDALAAQSLEVAGWALGVGIGNAVNLINPQRVILGGGVTKAGPALWGPLRRVAREVARSQIRLDIVSAALGDDAPLWGAVALAQDVSPQTG